MPQAKKKKIEESEVGVVVRAVILMDLSFI